MYIINKYKRKPIKFAIYEIIQRLPPHIEYVFLLNCKRCFLGFLPNLKQTLISQYFFSEFSVCALYM